MQPQRLSLQVAVDNGSHMIASAQSKADPNDQLWAGDP